MSRSQISTSRLMCSDGAWLNGRSKLPRAVNSAPETPSSSVGRANEKRSGKATKHSTETRKTGRRFMA